MPAFTYTGDAGRYYPELGLTVTDGQTVELDEAPADGRFTAAADATPVPVPDPVAAPADDAAPAQES